jgi:hypothetical protein
MGLARGKDVDDAAADREFSVLVGRVLARKTRVDEQFGEIGRRDVLAGSQIQRSGEHPFGCRDAGQKRGGRRDEDPGRAAGDRIESACTGGGDAHVGRHPAVGVDLVRRKRQDDPFGRRRRQPFERAQKERHVGAGLFEVAVSGQYVQHDPVGLRLRGRRDKQRFRRAGQARDDARRDIHPAARDRGLENGAKIERGRGGHGVRRRVSWRALRNQM